uniref:Uncharacterized protein n=1 Tax=Peromyscus maniculatus bairdii TaxID=230844 RepID=A0A8C8UG89_PERMB
MDEPLLVKTLELNQDFCFIIGFASEDNLEDEIKYNLMKMNPVEEKEGFLSPPGAGSIADALKKHLEPSIMPCFLPVTAQRLHYCK